MIKIKVSAYLIIDNYKTKVKVIDVPTDKCNREDFIPYIKHVLLDCADIKVEFELGDIVADSK